MAKIPYQLPSGVEICKKISKITNGKTLLSFSRGKDSIASYLVLREHFSEIYPYFYYIVPGLEFVEEDIARWEKIIGQHIVQLPAPGLYRMLKNHVYNSPDRVQWIDDCDLPSFTHDDLQYLVAEKFGLDPTKAWNALGIRAKDSVARNYEVKRSGGINWQRRIFYPCADMSKDELIQLIKASGIKLPVDYRLFGCSFDGIYARFLVPIKQHFPNDYKKILEYFPLAEVEVYRAEKLWGMR